ncbi:hypothetical protein ABFS82_09G097100 [Erythranthe guttata]|nr:PREDICTED: uncharacterized protein LOC105975486 [Erythranthe guttata]|eukprot:XP_012856139.1 PREDICTED: uncharacterized protein LOC105975486 [Erythranthe guttata]
MTCSISATSCTLLVLLLCVGFASSYNYANNGGFEGNGNKQRIVTYNYDRMGEVNKECAYLLQSAEELKPDDSRLYTIKEELSFSNGDWRQPPSNGSGRAAAPLMPFNDRDLSGYNNAVNPLNLVSFWVTDVDPNHRYLKKTIPVSGFLQITTTIANLLPQKPDDETPRFDIWPGNSQLSIRFQGVYTELAGERVMCLLGSAVLPSRGPHSNDPWPWVQENGDNNHPVLAPDDRILLELRYPKALTLRTREIYGSLKSLNGESDLKYFDEVFFSSSLGSANYKFASDDLVSRACDSMNGGIETVDDVYRGVDFCEVLERFSRREQFTVLPNFNCNGTDEFCRKLGPFLSGKEIESTNGGFKNVKLVFQDVRCENITTSKTRVSSVFRAVPPSEEQFSPTPRTGLNGMTLSAEGAWYPSTGRLCMVACSPYDNICHTRISMYVPLLFSIKQRSVFSGTLSSIDLTVRSYFPLAFEKPVGPNEQWSSGAHYEYSKIEAATSLLEKYEPSKIRSAVKKSFLKFPKLENTEENLPYSISVLSEDLTLLMTAVPDPLPSSLIYIQLQIEILTIGPFFGRYSNQKDSISFNPTPLLNVSAQINLVGIDAYNYSSVSVEGIYNPLFGKMYLIGCAALAEKGLDCKVEVVISYPPTTDRWLVDPTAKISMISQREKEDPLYFNPIKIHTAPVLYRNQREDILSRRGVEGILRIATLSLAIGCISSQLFYVRGNIVNVPYVSLVMLGVQAISYGLPLITGAEALFGKIAKMGFENLQKGQPFHVIDYMVKFLVLIAFLSTMRLCQKVWKSRVRMLTRSPLEPHRVPNDKKVLFATSIVHILGYILALIVHLKTTRYDPRQRESFVDSNEYSRPVSAWEAELVEYVGLMQDFFLLPQVIGNLLWMVQVKPLRKMYYIGLTLVRIFPHVYDFVKSPFPSNPYNYSNDYEFLNPRTDFYSKFGDIAIPIVSVILAVIVYVQQRWNYEKLRGKLVARQAKLLPLGSRVYERLPSSLSFEAELASGVNGDSTLRRDSD